MDYEFTINIEAAEIPVELKIALEHYFQEFEELKPSLPPSLQLRFSYWLGQLFHEATDLSVQIHWWESALDLISKEIEPMGQIAQPLIAAGRQLAPCMMAHLGPYTDVTLRELTEDTVVTVCRLSDTLTEPQKSMVAPNAISLSQALFDKRAWYRAIYAGKAAVGFIMLLDDDEEPNYFIWRLMIAEPCQGRGYGAQAIQRLVEYVKTRPNAKELGVSCVPGSDGPEQFYLKQGFVSTGEIHEGELVLKKSLS